MVEISQEVSQADHHGDKSVQVDQAAFARPGEKGRRVAAGMLRDKQICGRDLRTSILPSVSIRGSWLGGLLGLTVAVCVMALQVSCSSWLARLVDLPWRPYSQERDT
jgi:hypothetical protein